MRTLGRNTKRATTIRGWDNGVATAAAKFTGAMVLAFALSGCKWAGYAPAMVNNRSAGYAYITNNGDGTVSQFSRQADGTLIFQRMAKAGAVDGPIGIAAEPSNRFVYVANDGDNPLYQFRV